MHSTTTYYYRRQLPLTYAWAVTIAIHKTQGRTLDHIVVDPTGIFDRGMAYISISRTKSIDGLHLLAPLKSEHVLLKEADSVSVNEELQRLHTLFNDTESQRSSIISTANTRYFAYA